MSMVQIQMLGLIACRVFSFMSVAPILSERNFPNLCKLILGGGLILSAFSLAAAFEKEVALAVFILMAVKETIFGLAMGYLCRLVFFGVMITGQFIDFLLCCYQFHAILLCSIVETVRPLLFYHTR